MKNLGNVKLLQDKLPNGSFTYNCKELRLCPGRSKGEPWFVEVLLKGESVWKSFDEIFNPNKFDHHYELILVENDNVHSAGSGYLHPGDDSKVCFGCKRANANKVQYHTSFPVYYSLVKGRSVIFDKDVSLIFVESSPIHEEMWKNREAFLEPVR